MSGARLFALFCAGLLQAPVASASGGDPAGLELADLELVRVTVDSLEHEAPAARQGFRLTLVATSSSEAVQLRAWVGSRENAQTIHMDERYLRNEATSATPD